MVENLPGKLPQVNKLNILTAVEVFALAHAELGLELFPLHLYKGVIKGNLIFKGEIPLMMRVTYLNHTLPLTHNLQGCVKLYSEKGYISEEDLKVLRENGFIVGIEKIPALFIIAPIETRGKDHMIEVRKDPIILIKMNENVWVPVHAWNHSPALSAKLAEMN